VTANLETPIDPSQSMGLVPELMLNNMYFNGNHELFDIFNGQGKFKGFDVLSLANNHSLDQGVSGLLATMRFLKEKEIAYCGAALSDIELDDFPILNRNGINVAFLGATYSLNALIKPKNSSWIVNHLALNNPNPEIDLLIRQSKQARNRGADLVMAHLHMGFAYQALPSMDIVDNMHMICEQTGIDVLIGSHPHNAQPLELYSYVDPWSGKQKQSLVIYSLGDFIAYDIFKWCHLPMMLKLQYTRIDSQVVLTNVSLKMGFMEALIEKGKVQKLMLRDIKQLRKNPSFMSKRAAKEFNELLPFADFLLDNQGLRRFLV
jgi:poly-gamma-glutamate synthesis protein (capsule biosynthesis protein)